MKELGRSFDIISEEYLNSRSEYSAQFIEHVVEAARLLPNDSLLDTGCGSGQATVAFFLSRLLSFRCRTFLTGTETSS